MAPSKLKTDCREFHWDRPCKPHKSRGRTCPDCPEYAPVRRRILVVKLAAIGDVLRTTALLPAIHARYPDARVTWLTQPAAVPLFERNPLVDEVLSFDSAITAARLRVETFDVVLCPDADPDAAVLAAAAQADDHRGFLMNSQGAVVPVSDGARAWFEMGLSDATKIANRETYQTLVSRVLDLDPTTVGRPVLEPSEADVVAAAKWRASLACDRPLVGLNTGAGGRWAYKQWTEANQIEFLRLATQRGLGVVLLGGPEETQRHRSLLAAVPNQPIFDAGTKNSFHRFAALVDLCDALVTGDTFALHVGCARNKPIVALFGPTSSAEIELYGQGEKIEPTGFDCLCCYLPRCDRVPHCQAAIAAEPVLAAVERLLATAR